MKTNEDELKNEDVLKNYLPTPQQFCPPPPITILPELFWWPLILTATPQMMLSRKCYQVSKPEIEFHIMNIMYAALHMRAYRKDDIFMQRRLAQRIKCIGKWGQGTKSPEFLQKVQPFHNSNFDKTFLAEAYSCLQVCVFGGDGGVQRHFNDQP